MHKLLASSTLALASLLALAGCAATPGAEADDTVQVVASTNVYGSLVAEIGGDRVTVTSLIDSAGKDPHSYEASARDRLAVQKADLVVQNGGGYDAFLTELLDGSDAAVVTAVEPDEDADAEHTDQHTDEHADHEHDHSVNEHVWFDVHTMSHVVEHITEELTTLDPAGKADFAAASEGVLDELTAVEADLDALRADVEGTEVFITEPLPGLLANAAGLEDVAPEGFAAAVEEGNDVAPATLLAALEVIETGDVRAVLANAQTGGPETERIEAAAEAAGIPVVTFNELLQSDQSYAEWMRSALDDLTAALRR